MKEQVTFSMVGNRSSTLTVDLIGDDTIDGGVGGWEILDRPGRRQSVAWTGVPAVTWVLPLIFSTPDLRRSVEGQIARFKKWTRPTGVGEPPPALYVKAPVGRGASGAKWVVQDLEWGAQIRNDSGNRVQQELTVTLLRYTEGQVLRGPAAKSKSAGKKKRHKWVPVSSTNRLCKRCRKTRKNANHLGTDSRK